jgi:isochorismate synthase
LDGFDPAAGFFFGHAGDTLVTHGAAAAIEAPARDGQVSAAADAAAGALREHPGALAVGALPFRPDRPARLVIPGHAARAGSDERTPGPPAPWTGRGLTMRAEPSLESYRRAVSEAVARIEFGAFEKVVLARSLVVRAARPWDAVALLRRLRAADPASYTFAVPSGDAVLVGASPELLVSRRGREVRTNPLAGSARRTGDATADRDAAAKLLADAKNRREHRFVVDAARDALTPFCEELDVAAEPEVLATARVMHLSTRIRGRLRDPEPTALHLAGAMHPTPAVCGTPTDAALAAIADLEGIDRGLYAGLVGWVDAAGDGEWAVTLRCAELRGDTAVLFAGAGIVEGSEPQPELDETDAKLATLLDALAAG